MFTPNVWENDPIWWTYFSNGLKPTRIICFIFSFPLFSFFPGVYPKVHMTRVVVSSNSNIFLECSPRMFGKMIQFDEHIFQMGWNRLESYPSFFRFLCLVSFRGGILRFTWLGWWFQATQIFFWNVHPECLGKWSNLTSILFKWVETNYYIESYASFFSFLCLVSFRGCILRWDMIWCSNSLGGYLHHQPIEGIDCHLFFFEWFNVCSFFWCFLERFSQRVSDLHTLRQKLTWQAGKSLWSTGNT